MNTNLVVVPSRGRPQNVQRSFDAITSKSKISDLVFGLDNDDDHNYPRIPGAQYDVMPRFRMNKTLNLIALKNKNKYETITFMGDDHLVETEFWDEILYEPIKKRGYGLSYGNDSLQKQGLPTAVMISTNIIKILGFMAPHDLEHLMMDVFWLDLGKALDAIDYFDNVSIKHLHYSSTPGIWDKTYEEANSDRTIIEDGLAYKKYYENQFLNDVDKIKKALA